MRFSSATEQQVENYRKMLLSMAEDARVILVKQTRRERERQVAEEIYDLLAVRVLMPRPRDVPTRHGSSQAGWGSLAGSTG